MRMFGASMYAMNRSGNVWLFVEQANHLLSRDHEDSRRRDRGRRFKANGMTRERVLTEEVARSEHPDDGLSTGVRQHGASRRPSDCRERCWPHHPGRK
jgi:hypothetical protein